MEFVVITIIIIFILALVLASCDSAGGKEIDDVIDTLTDAGYVLEERDAESIAYYQANNLQQVQSTLNRPWQQVKTDGTTNFQWQYWLDNFTWEGVLVVEASDLYGVNPADVYKTYLGTNKIIIDDSEGMIFDAEKLRLYSDTDWQTTVKIPV